MDIKIFKWLALSNTSTVSFEVTIYNGKTKEEQYHTPESGFSLVPYYAGKLLSLPENQCLYVTDSLLAFGVVRNKGTTYTAIFGPIMLEKSSMNLAERIAKEINLPTDKKNELYKRLKITSSYNLYDFRGAIVSFYVSVNHDLEGVDLTVIPQINISESLASSYDQSAELIAKEEMEGAEFCRYFEDRQVTFIQAGQPEKLKEYFPYTYKSRTILMSLSAERSYKDRCISSIAILCRAAVDAGLDITTDYILNDMYIQKIEDAETISQMQEIQYRFLIDLCTRVGQAKNNSTGNPIVNRAQRFVNEHIREKITTKDVAEAFHISPSYLSSNFHKETGERFLPFISRMKVEEAKRLLKMTTKALADISNYLSFSSQSYFQNVFKEITGMTPLDYRRKENEQKQN
ncbi:MAG: AraC family transcriptional regulator [Bacilli bacterium]|jgi:AraC-like DNA-binding protein|nr:AraC family transcriptional regulator [Bacilli bacterium]